MDARNQPAYSQNGDEMVKRIHSLIDSQVMRDTADQKRLKTPRELWSSPALPRRSPMLKR